MILSILAVVLGALISLPLGYFIAHSRFLDKLILVPLNLMQSIPTLSFFGLLFPILSFLGSIAVFAAIGITGIGWAPALIVLTAYTLLPIVRNTQAGYRNISPEYLECGKSLGMNKFQLLVEIELPLASPLIITGLRIALVQTIGAAVLAGLVGAGGLGSLLFLGLAQSSIDLIILSIIPIVFFTLLLDSIFKSGENILRRKINDTV
ncbi:MAG: ABC transporter permease subunit [Fusobacteria bacterium]|nr:ABC transporter permease subunit [Fusobacteriota bacterium]